MLENPTSASPTEPNGDFTPEQIAPRLNKHDEDIVEVKNRLDFIEGKLSTPQKIADFLEEASRDSKKLDLLISQLFCNMLDKDENVKKSIEIHMEKVDRKASWKLIKKWGGLFAAGIIYLGLITTKVIDKLFS